MNKEPRLRFTDEERSDPALEKPIRKAEKAAARADKAQANIPTVSYTHLDVYKRQDVAGRDLPRIRQPLHKDHSVSGHQLSALPK